MAKRRITTLLLALLYSSFIVFGSAHAEEHDDSFAKLFVFPSSLQVIQEEAFMGTGVRVAVFRNGLQYLGDRAFNRTCLSQIYIPSSITFISDSAIPRNKNLKIFGENGSYAQQWAVDHLIPFITTGGIDLPLNRGAQIKMSDIGILRLNKIPDPKKSIEDYKKTENTDRNMRPENRPELYPIDYRFP